MSMHALLSQSFKGQREGVELRYTAEGTRLFLTRHTYAVGWLVTESRYFCSCCTGAFGTFVWKHHCRMCGGVTCEACSKVCRGACV